MNLEYRGYSICLEDDGAHCALLVEVETGTVLPTKIVGSPQESWRDLAARACRLIDLYMMDEGAAPRRPAP